MITLKSLAESNPYAFKYKTLYKAIQRGQLKAKMIAGEWWTSQEWFAQWLATPTVKTAAKPVAEPIVVPTVKRNKGGRPPKQFQF